MIHNCERSFKRDKLKFLGIRALTSYNFKIVQKVMSNLMKKKVNEVKILSQKDFNNLCEKEI